MVKKSLTDKCEHRPEGSERVSHKDPWGKNILAEFKGQGGQCGRSEASKGVRGSGQSEAGSEDKVFRALEDSELLILKWEATSKE